MFLLSIKHYAKRSKKSSIKVGNKIWIDSNLLKEINSKSIFFIIFTLILFFSLNINVAASTAQQEKLIKMSLSYFFLIRKNFFPYGKNRNTNYHTNR